MSKCSTRFTVLAAPAILPDFARNMLLDAGIEIETWEHDDRMSLKAEFMKRIADVDALITSPSYGSIDEDLIEKATKLKVIGTVSVGLDHLNLNLLRDKRIRVGYTPGVLTESCADLILCLTLATMRRIFEAHQAIVDGQWPAHMRPLFWMCGKSLFHSVVGMVGFGRIGQAVVRRLLGFKPKKIFYHCKNRKAKIEDELQIAWQSDLDQMMGDCDVIIVICALTEDTKGFITKHRLRLMKRGSFFINASRGSVVDQDGLVELLREGHFGGVGLDVMTPSPLPPNHELLTFKECTIVPHISSACVETRERMARLTVENVIAGLENREMPAEYI